mmetsp:Transcript_13861/g.18954  ORF Transcript_13861/g.18954 Transcript_13861/m.18954 type:complete len:269 (-) Transcript_13861:50-856(-)
MSLFLSLYTALDDIFPDAGLVFSTLQTIPNDSNPSPNTLNPSHKKNNFNNQTNHKELSNKRLPLVHDSHQQAQMALMSLFDRGMREAEKRLEVISFLHSVAHSVDHSVADSVGNPSLMNPNDKNRVEIIRAYHTVKNRLQALSRVSSSTCKGLRPNWWIVLSMFVIDAAVRHTLQLRNLQESSVTSSSSTSSSKSSSFNDIHTHSVSSSSMNQSEMDRKEGKVSIMAVEVGVLWEQKVVSAVCECLGVEAVNSLRPGDLTSLRTFFFR